MHSSTTAVLLLLALFGTSIVDACDEHAAQAMAFTLSTDISTWNGATDMFGLTKNNFHVTRTSPGQYKTELQLDCCCDSDQNIGSPASVCMTKCGSSPDDLNVWKKETAVINGVKVEFDFKDLGPPDPALLEMGSAKKRLGNKAKVKKEQTWDGGHRFETRRKKGISRYHREYGRRSQHGPAARFERAATAPYGREKRRRRLLQNSDGGS